MTVRSGPFLGLLLCLAVLPAQARSHLDRGELKILAASSVAVVYVDGGPALEPSLDPAHHMLGVTPLTAVLADVVNRYRLHVLLAHIGPYRAAVDKLPLSESTQQGLRQALLPVPWLGKAPWTEVRQDPRDALFLTRQAQAARAPVVVFIRPQLFMEPDAGALYMECNIDIETAGPGVPVSHYDSSDVIISEPVDDAGLPAPDRTHDLGDRRMARLFANGAEGFQRLYSRLLARSQQQLYYYFTGDRPASPAPVAR